MLSSEYIKSYLLLELEKALKKLGKLRGTHTGGHAGLVQVERTITKKGTTFTQKFWIKPDQVKDTDVVMSKPNESQKTASVTHTFEAKGKSLAVIHQDADFTSSKALDGLDKHLKGIAKDLIKKELNRAGQEVANKLSWHGTPEGVHVDTPLEFKAQLHSVNMPIDIGDSSGITGFTIQYESPFKVGELDGTEQRWLINLFRGPHEIGEVVTVGDKIAVQITHNEWDYAIDYKMELLKENYQEMAELAQQNLNQTAKPSSVQPKTDREKELFGEFFSKMTSSQLRNARTTGICATDDQAHDFLGRLCTGYVAGIHGGNINSETSNKLMKGKLSELKEFLKNRIDNLKQVLAQHPTGYFEDNEIKTKLSTASQAEFEAISKQIRADWDQENHGNMQYKIHGVYKVENMPVEDEFNEWVEFGKQYADEEAGGKNCGLDTFYHGTDPAATVLILGHSGQFEVTNTKAGKMLGDAVYLAGASSKSAQFMNPSGFSRGAGRGALMVCDAVLGDCLWDPPDFDEFDEEKLLDVMGEYYSMGVDGCVLNPEWAVYNPDAVKPKYLIDLEILPKEE